MKHLLLMRHAKAVPAEPGMTDRDRRLAERGHRDAALIGHAIAEDSPPDLILCSPSLRTRETMTEVIAAFPDSPDVVIDEAVYGGSAEALLAALEEHGGQSRRLLVIGHNPTIHETAVMLASSPDAKMRSKFPTSALAVLAFDSGERAAIRPGRGRLIRFVRPKDLGARDADD